MSSRTWFHEQLWRQQRMMNYLNSFYDDEPADGSDTADDYGANGTNLDALQRLAEKAKRDHDEGRTARLEPLANDADDARTSQHLHDAVEDDPDKTLTVDVEFRRKLAQDDEQ